MKKLLTFLMAVALISGAAMARDRVTTDVKELPEAARTLLSKYYPDAGINHIKIDKGVFSNDYEVVLDNGVEIDFDDDGALTEIEAGRMGVPDGLVMKSIRDYVAANYPGRKIESMDIDRWGYDVQVSGDVDHVFDRSGKFKRIDD